MRTHHSSLAEINVYRFRRLLVRYIFMGRHHASRVWSQLPVARPVRQSARNLFGTTPLSYRTEDGVNRSTGERGVRSLAVGDRARQSRCPSDEQCSKNGAGANAQIPRRH